jgi:hypothetical protein
MSRMKALVVVIAVCLAPSSGQAALIAKLEQISPIALTYLEHVNFETFTFGAVGDATGLLEAVPGFGSAADFSGFTPGNIALISRGNIDFQDKVTNAELAGAIAALIYNNVPGAPVLGTLQTPTTTIPALSLSQTLGQSLLVQLEQGNVTMRVSVSEAVPEPASLTIWGLGAMGCAVAGYRRRKAT